MNRETELVRGGTPPLDHATIHPYVDAIPGPFFYQRTAHPVGAEAERVLGGTAYAFRLDIGLAFRFGS